MTRDEESAIVKAWHVWLRRQQQAGAKPVTNQTYSDFYFDVVQRDRRLGRILVFEVLDVLVNAQSPTEAARLRRLQKARSEETLERLRA